MNMPTFIDDVIVNYFVTVNLFVEMVPAPTALVGAGTISTNKFII